MDAAMLSLFKQVSSYREKQRLFERHYFQVKIQCVNFVINAGQWLNANMYVTKNIDFFLCF